MSKRSPKTTERINFKSAGARRVREVARTAGEAIYEPRKAAPLTEPTSLLDRTVAAVATSMAELPEIDWGRK